MKEKPAQYYVNEGEQGEERRDAGDDIVEDAE